MSQLAQGLGYTPGNTRRTPGRNGPTPKRTPGGNPTTPGRSVGGDNSSSGHIKVVVRVRPPNSQEQGGNFKNVVEVLDDHMLVFDPKEHSSPDYYQRKRRPGRDLLKKANRDIRFAFDQVYGMESTNEDVYERTTKMALDALLDGFNCSVFAYGATGAGKTFTMLGRSDHPGVMFLTMMDLYSRIDAMKETKSCDVAVSYMEVYNEQIRDLLLPSGFLPIREDPAKGVMISGLSLHKPRSAQELMHMLEFGNKNRTQHPTDANAESSRSHAVFQVFVRMKDRTAGLSADVTVAKMSLIDLAGSERATVTKNSGARFREGANINRSLLALGNCINALADGKAKGYVPYRNSKLTRLLKDSLGGNCKTIMIAAVSPSAMSYEDTYNTLKYANRAKNIKANLTRKVVSVDYHVTKYVQIVEELRVEVAELKDKLSQYESGAILPAKCSRLDDVNMQEISRINSLLFSVFEERISIRKELMEMEGSMRDLAFKIHLKEVSIHRIKILITDPVEIDQAKEKMEKAVTGFKKRQESIGKRKFAIEARVEENSKRLERAESEMQDVQKNCSMPELLETELRCRHLEVELRDTRRHVRHLKKLCRHQQRSAKSNEEVVSKLLRIVKNQYYILKGHGLATSDINQEFENLTYLIEGKAGVNFDESVMEKSTMSISELDTVPSSQESQFDINPLVEFPVLSCVPITPKTPHRSKSRLSFSANGYPLTPKTPMTPGDAMTPVTPVTPAWQEESSLGATPAALSLTQIRVEPVAPSNDLAQITSSSCNSSLVGGETGRNHSRVISKAIESTVMQCLDISNLSHTSSVDSSQLSNTSKIDSSRSLQSVNGRCANVSSDVSNVRVYGANSKPKTSSGVTINARTPNHDINETFTFDKIMDGVYPLKNDSPRPVLGDRTQAVQNAGTVTKERPSVEVPVVKSNTVTKTTVNSGTVTKGKAENPKDMIKVIEAAGLQECSTPPKDRRTSVVRSFNFEGMSCPSPAGQLTFAQALKSPAPLKLLREEHRNSSPRSPLTPRTNLPDFTPEERTQGKVSFAEDVLFNKQRPVSSKKYRQHHPYSASKIKHFQEPKSGTSLLRRHSVHVGRNQVSEDVKRMGLPSILEKRDKLMLSSASSTSSSEVPSYMQLTKAASRRRRNHRRSVSHDESADKGKTMIPSIPRRIASKENTKPGPNRILLQKSKSSAHIGQKSTFF